jgi:two-component system chemotaxis response regulator CheB
MKLRVCLAVKSTFTAIALRKSLGDYPNSQVLGEERTCPGTEKLLTNHPSGLAVIDLDLLADPDSQGLTTLLAQRREPTILINARGIPVPATLTNKPAIRVLTSRRPGELDIGHIQELLIPALCAAREAWVQAGPAGRTTNPALSTTSAMTPLTSAVPRRTGAAELVVIGVSTGGPTLLVKMLKDLIKPTIPMLIAQHMPASETAGFALRLSEEIRQSVVEVGAGPLAEVGRIGLVQGGKDFQILRNPNGRFRLKEAVVPHNPFHPSIDHLLLTAAEAGIAVHTAILTGMGQDGSVGALALMKQGYPVIAQRPETCAVAGMPSAAINNGAAQQVQSPEQIVESINRWFAAVKAPATPEFTQ